MQTVNPVDGAVLGQNFVFARLGPILPQAWLNAPVGSPGQFKSGGVLMSAASEPFGDLGHVYPLRNRAQGEGDLLAVDPETGGEGMALCHHMAGIGCPYGRNVTGRHGMPSDGDDVAARGDDLSD